MFRGMAASPREAVVHTVLAVAAAVLLRNLERQAGAVRRNTGPAQP
jgi:hypothetical protein